ncbi:hypothetical protein F1880_001331 [Penicillium rolfsii]|nr:hypothetical protein F1880_001331 [Penicillium rolfsii]
MRVKKSTEPRDAEGASDQKQDPLERRRLQNRLSQRNHRRKIRDRIAKLQERVIANELRAAAALNGWDRPYTPPPILGPRHVFQQESGLGSGTANNSPTMTDPFSNFGSSYGLSMTSPWPSTAAPSSTLLPGDSPWLWNIGLSPINTANPNPTVCDPTSDATIQSFAGSVEEHIFPDLSSTGRSPHSSANVATSTNQSLYYTVTGESIEVLQIYSQFH